MTTRNFFFVIIVLSALLSFLNPGSTKAAAPATLNYQGYLNDAVGQPVSGTREITFSLYTASTGGEPFWTEQQQSVPITDGRFSVVLGSSPTNVLNPSSFTGETYIGIKVGTDQEMSPRQKFTSVAYALQAGSGGIPSGGIIMWSGSVANIPSGWALCDGTNGTPDLRSKFILGAGSTYPVGVNGGEATHTLTEAELPVHVHKVNPPSTTSSGQSQTHTHTSHLLANKANARDDYDGVKAYSDNGTADSSYTGNASNDHTHAVDIAEFNSGSVGSGAAQNNMPPYYTLAFIMKL